MIRGSGVSGYTIVEVMVFLTISSVLFVSALTAVSGRQATVQFNQSVRDAQSKLQDVISQTSTGFVPDSGNVSCTAPGNSPTPPVPVIDNSGTAEQGSNGECVFLGKALWFKQGAADADSVEVISVAGRRLKDSKLDASSLLDARPTAIAPIDVANSTNIPDLTQTIPLQFGLTVTGVRLKSTPGVEYGAVFLYSSFPNAGGAGLVVSGAQHLNFGVLFKSDTDTAAIYPTINSINRVTDTAAGGRLTLETDTESGIVVCLADDSDRKAMLTMGVGGSQSVALDVGAYDTAVCP